MKNRILIIVLTLVALVTNFSIQINATDYCGDAVINASGHNMHITCKKEGGNYVMIFELTTETFYSLNNAYGNVGSSWSDFKNYGVLSGGNKIATFTFPQQPTPSGTPCLFLIGSSSGYTYYWPSDINWNASCTPADATPPTFSSVSAGSISNTKATITVVAADAVGITRVVIKNGATTLKDETITSTTSLNQGFNITGLTKNTSYTLTAYCYDAAGNSSNRNVSFTTANNPSKTVYFVNSGTASSWAQPYIHYWGSGSGETTFPGSAMDNTGWTNCDNTGIWTADVEGTNSNCIFNQGNSTNQTATRTVSENQFYNYEVNSGAGAWFDIASGIYMMGDMTNWTDDKASDKAFSTWSGSSPTYVTWSKKLAASTTYEFKILHKKNDTWTWGGNSGTITSATNFNSPNRWWEMDNTSSNCKITTSIAGRYTFYYDFTANRLKVVYPTPPVGCSGTTGTPTTGSGPTLSYTFLYTNNTIYLTARPSTGTFESCKFNYAENNSGGSVTTLNMTLNSDRTEATLAIPATGICAAGRTIYHTFTYKAGSMGSEGSSISGWYSAPTYVVGNCVLDDDEPYMISAAVNSKTSSSVTIDVSAIVNDDLNAVTVFHVDNGYDYIKDANGRITITGLTPNTAYNFTIYAVYNGLQSTNSKSISVTTNKISECEGSRGHFTDATWDQIYYEIRYTAASKQLQFIVTCPTQTLTTLQTEWNVEGIRSSGGMQNFNLSTGTYTYTCPNDIIGKEMAIRFQYGYSGKDGLSVTADNLSFLATGIIYYVVGECSFIPESNPPAMNSVSVYQNSTGTSVILNVNATDDTTNPVTKFYVGINGGEYDGTEYTLYNDYDKDGKIEVTGLDYCENYTFTVYCKDDAGNLSTSNSNTNKRYQSVTIKTAIPDMTNLALNKSAYYGYEGNTGNRGRHSVDGDLSTRGGTQNGTDTEHVLCVNLGKSHNLNKVRIYWEQARPTDYEIQVSNDSVSWTSVHHLTTAPKCNNQAAPTRDNANHYEDYSLTGYTGQYVRVKANILVDAGWGISIWEMEVYSTNECFVEDDVAPRMLSASVDSYSGTTAILNVSADDDKTNPVTLFVIDGKTYIASAGKITINSLAPCNSYDWRIYAKDNAGNLSSQRSETQYQYKDVHLDLPMTNPGTTNIALQKPAYAGFTQGGYAPEYAVDGTTSMTPNANRRWASDGAKYIDNDWLAIDLGGIYEISKVRVYWERGTSYNYMFQSAYNITFGKQLETRTGGDVLKDSIVSGVFSTFEHQNEKPSSAQQASNNFETEADPKAYNDYIYTEPVVGRYIRVTSDLKAQWHSSIWEIEVYGNCYEPDGKPIMQWAEEIATGVDESLIYVSSIDRETSTDRMTYYVKVTTDGDIAENQNTSYYTFTYTQYYNGEIGRLLIGGLLPDMDYELEIWAIDGDGNMSDNSKIINISTSAATSCEYGGDQAYKVGSPVGATYMSSDNFQYGYSISISTNADKSFHIVVSTDDTYDDLDHTVLQFFPNFDTYEPPLGELREFELSPVAGKDRTYEGTISSSTNQSYASGKFIPTYSGIVHFIVKFQFHNGGIVCTYPIEYDIDKGCLPSFVIYHHNDAPSTSCRVQYAGGTILEKILYYRRFAPGVWEPFTVPFVVDSVRVYDTDDHQWYRLRAQYNNGSKHSGDYWLKEQEVAVSGDDFENTWHDGTHTEPQRYTPYNMAVPRAGNYYAGKYLVFHGAKNQVINGTFERGDGDNLEAGPNNRYTLYANNTMMPQADMYAYQETEDGEYYSRQEGWTLYPFECYVLANEVTMSAMMRPGPWHAPSVTTDIDELTLTTDDPVQVYNLLGQYLMTIQPDEEMLMRLPSGCYIFHCGNKTGKVLIP